MALVLRQRGRNARQKEEGRNCQMRDELACTAARCIIAGRFPMVAATTDAVVSQEFDSQVSFTSTVRT